MANTRTHTFPSSHTYKQYFQAKENVQIEGVGKRRHDQDVSGAAVVDINADSDCSLIDFIYEFQAIADYTTWNCNCSCNCNKCCGIHLHFHFHTHTHTHFQTLHMFTWLIWSPTTTIILADTSPIVVAIVVVIAIYTYYNIVFVFRYMRLIKATSVANESRGRTKHEACK